VPSIEPLAPVSKSRTDLSIYGEAVVPILGKEYSYPGARRLELSLAYRLDSYTHFGTSYNPKVGWLWEPVAGIAVRGTYSTSFKAPLLSQLDAPTTAYTTVLPGNLPDGRPTDLLVISGGNESLKSETSRSITVGLDWTPPRWSGVRASITYFDVAYDNRIQSQNVQAKALLSQPQLLALNGTLDPTLNLVVPYFEGPGFQNDGVGLGPAGVSALIDNRLANTGSTVERGIRLDGRYARDVGLGSLGLSLSATYLGVDRTQAFSNFPVTDVADTSGEPPKFRLQGGIGWKWRSLTSDLTVNYWGAYRDTLVDPAQEVGSWTTEDLALVFSPQGNPPFSRFSMLLNLQNVLDRRPPFLAIPLGEIAVGRSAVPFDGTNASAVGRYVSLEIRKGWQ
jgi:outer membrane receptor protein involved in Fe transport